MRKHLEVAQMVLHHANVPRVVCDHLLGNDHSNKHRMAVGGVVMVVGVYVAKVAAHSHFIVIEIGADLLGYLVHGIGAIPYVDALITTIKGDTEDGT